MTPNPERTAIVAWLLYQVEKGSLAMASAKDGSRLQRDYAAAVVAIENAATAIEAGDHLKDNSQ